MSDSPVDAPKRPAAKIPTAQPPLDKAAEPTPAEPTVKRAPTHRAAPAAPAGSVEYAAPDYEVPVKLNPHYAPISNFPPHIHTSSPHVYAVSPHSFIAGGGGGGGGTPQKRGQLAPSTPTRAAGGACLGLDTTMAMLATPNDKPQGGADGCGEAWLKDSAGVATDGNRAWLKTQSWYLDGMSRDEVRGWLRLRT